MPQYSKAPVTEAIIDFQLQYQCADFKAACDEFVRSLGAAYPESKIRNSWQIHLGDEGQPNVRQEALQDGIAIFGKDRKFVVQVRNEGFSVSRLAPYVNWDEFISEFKYLWGQYKTFFNPQVINKISVRFINEIAIPAATFSLNEYFVSPPSVPPGIEAHMTEVFSRSMLNFISGARAIVTFASAPAKGIGTAVFVLDIDAFISGAYGVNDDLFLSLTQLQVEKDLIFEKYLTMKTKEMFL
jgi:hypothetical protein